MPAESPRVVSARTTGAIFMKFGRAPATTQTRTRVPPRQSTRPEFRPRISSGPKPVHATASASQVFGEDGIGQKSAFPRQPHVAVALFEQSLSQVSREGVAGELLKIETGLLAELGERQSVATSQVEHDEFAGPFFG